MDRIASGAASGAEGTRLARGRRAALVALLPVEAAKLKAGFFFRRTAGRP